MSEWVKQTKDYTTALDVIINYIEGDKSKRRIIKNYLNRINFNNDIWKIINENKSEEEIYITKQYLSKKERNIKLPNNKHKDSIEHILEQFDLFYKSLSPQYKKNINLLNKQMKDNLLFVNLDDNSFEHGVHYKFVEHINNLEFKFNYVIKLDIKDFFKNIYTHVLIPSLINEQDLEIAKELNKKRNWENKIIKTFNSHKGETNGLTLGSFFSVLWSEILMNRIISDLKQKTKNNMIYSFGDDILIFHNSSTYDTSDFLIKYKNETKDILNKYSPDNSLFVLNEEKQQLQYYVDWYNEQMTFYNYKKTFSKNPTIDKLLFQFNNMEYQKVDKKIQYSYIYKQFKEFNISNKGKISIETLQNILNEKKIVDKEEIEFLSSNIECTWIYEPLGKYGRRVIKDSKINIKSLIKLISLEPSILMYINNEYFNNEEKVLLNYELNNLLTKYSENSYEMIVIENYLNRKNDNFNYCNEIPHEFDKNINRKLRKMDKNYSKYIVLLENSDHANFFQKGIKFYKLIKKIKMHFLKDYQLELKFLYGEKLRLMNDSFNEFNFSNKPFSFKPF